MTYDWGAYLGSHEHEMDKRAARARFIERKERTMNIIGISGFKRSGKGETGNVIADLLPNVRQLGFADKLKILAARSFGFNEGYTDEQRIALMDEAKEHWIADLIHEAPQPITPAVDLLYGFPEPPVRNRLRTITLRQYLQNLGNEARTVFGADFWVDQVLPQPSTLAPAWVHAMYPGVDTLVFIDMRYPNEAQRIRDLGGVNLRVVRPGVESDGHISELALPDELIDYTIYNDSDLEALKLRVEAALRVLV